MFFMSDVYTPTLLNTSCNILDYKKFLNEPTFDSGVNMTVKRRNRVRHQLNFKIWVIFLR